MSGDKKVVLIVDDERMLAEVIGFSFAKLGFNTIIEENPLPAIDQIENGLVDLIISDIKMPKGGGVAILNYLVKNELTYPPIIFITGYSDENNEELIAKGAYAILTKPIDKLKLEETAYKALKHAARK